MKQVVSEISETPLYEHLCLGIAIKAIFLWTILKIIFYLNVMLICL